MPSVLIKTLDPEPQVHQDSPGIELVCGAIICYKNHVDLPTQYDDSVSLAEIETALSILNYQIAFKNHAVEFGHVEYTNFQYKVSWVFLSLFSVPSSRSLSLPYYCNEN